MPRSLLLKTLFACTMALATALPAHAEHPLGPPEQRIRDSFATPYAGALLKNFVKSVRRSADGTCLQEKALDDAALAARGSELLQRYGIQLLKQIDETIDRDAQQKTFLENAGPRAASELDQLKRDADVKKLLAVARPGDLARTVGIVAENFDRYVLVGRIKLDPISPVARGEEEPPENPIEATDAALDKFLEKHPAKKKLNRYFDLLEANDEAMRKSMRPEAARKIGPMTFFAGADRGLAELCVGR